MRPWIKMHTTMLDDVRLLKLHERIQLRYVQAYLLAGRLNADGSFIDNGERLSVDDIAIKLRVIDRKQFAKDFTALKQAGLIKQNGHGPCIAAFDTEQVDWSRKQEQDRERQDRKRHGGVTRDESVTDDKSRNSHGGVTRLDQDQTKTKKEKKTKKEIKKKTTTNHPILPSSKKSAGKRDAAPSMDGGGGQVDSTLSIDHQLQELCKKNNNAAETVRIMKPILTADGLGNQKFKTLMVTVATRILPRDAKRMTLAALASAYADETALNKQIVAAHRLEHEQVPSQFMNPVTWKVIPENVLKAAGVDDLNDYIGNARRNKVEDAMNRFIGGDKSNNDAIRKVAKRVAGN